MTAAGHRDAARHGRRGTGGAARAWHAAPPWPASGDNGRVIEVDPGRFEEMVVTALDSLPDELGRLMHNVAVTVEHDAGPPGLLGLYEGIPLTSRTTNYAGVLPDRITIYRAEICRMCRTEDEVVDQVRRTVIHEVAHHFGIGDERLHELGW
jgi:predicted Zn-dependent protease with MMP-like domain